MEIRALEAKHFEERLKLSEYAFQFKLTPSQREQNEQKFRPEQELGAFDEQGELLSALTLLPLEIWVQGKPFAMGGLAGVATWPEARRLGCVSELLKRSLELMKGAGQTVSMLHPFAFAFYRKFGWEMTVERKAYTIAAGQLPLRKVTSGRMQRLAEVDSALLDEVYAKFVSRYTGTLVRTSEWWAQRVLSKPGHTAVYYNADDEVAGYVSYQIENRKMTIHELAVPTEEARTAIWTFISNHDSMLDEVTVTVANDDPLPFLLPDPRIKQELQSYFMTRIVDAEAFVSQYPFAAGDQEEALELVITDAHAEWNNGQFRLVFDADGTARLTRIEEEQSDMKQAPAAPQLALDIQTLSALLLGGRKASWLAEAGRITGDAEAAALLERRIPQHKTFLMDFF
ncbi:GNAT family N-acetyltransferase [Paenibacillus sp. FSL H8-0537]|uniref:GNAT family N-acetyltransferase n=1 Tax=Paenibacillus sp. FSL H8-0537 TaxID=2921399 RepID=UPI003100C817